MMFMRSSRVAMVLVVLAAIVLCGCSAKGDVEKICNVERLSGVTANDDPKQGVKMMAWLDDHVHSTKGRNVVQAMAQAPVDQKRAILLQAAKEVGYTGPCPMADTK